MKKLLLLPIILIFFSASAQFKFGMFAGAGRAPLIGIQTGYDFNGIYLNANLINKFSSSEPSQAEIRINYTGVRLSPYIGINKELYRINDVEAKQENKSQYNFTYGLQWRGKEDYDKLFNRLDRLFISAGMVGKTPMVLIGGAIEF